MTRGKRLLIGLTGGMGCGKSTAAAMFAERGFQRMDSDAYVRDVLYRDPAIVAAVRERFGGDAIGPDGQVRRDVVAERAFGDPAVLEWLENLLHPRLYEHWREIWAADDAGAWVAEVPLLFEKQLENWFDFTVCVTTVSGEQLRRLEQRGIPPSLARQRLAKQLSLARKCELADIVLLNDGPPEFLREQVNELAERWLPARKG